jgi:hypothetical protein
MNKLYADEAEIKEAIDKAKVFKSGGEVDNEDIDEIKDVLSGKFEKNGFDSNLFSFKN